MEVLYFLFGFTVAGLIAIWVMVILLDRKKSPIRKEDIIIPWDFNQKQSFEQMQRRFTDAIEIEKLKAEIRSWKEHLKTAEYNNQKLEAEVKYLKDIKFVDVPVGMKKFMMHAGDYVKLVIFGDNNHKSFDAIIHNPKIRHCETSQIFFDIKDEQ